MRVNKFGVTWERWINGLESQVEDWKVAKCYILLALGTTGSAVMNVSLLKTNAVWLVDGL